MPNLVSSTIPHSQNHKPQMANKLTLFSFSILIVLLLSAALMDGSVAREIVSQKRCQEMLYVSGCTLADCGKRCWRKHHEPGYECVANAGRTVYACYCFFNCG